MPVTRLVSAMSQLTLCNNYPVEFLTAPLILIDHSGDVENINSAMDHNPLLQFSKHFHEHTYAKVFQRNMTRTSDFVA